MNTKMQSVSMALLLTCVWVTPVLAADSKAGEEKAAICAGCHGPSGKSNNPQWPNLAAQQQTYFVNQLEAFKAGSRKNSIMQSMAANLTNEDMANLAVYFSSQPAVKAGGDPALAKIGQEKVAMCLGCHGQGAVGNGQFPRLAGQHPKYLETQLKNFKSGDRQSGHMNAIAGNLSEDDMKALAAYLGTL